MQSKSTPSSPTHRSAGASHQLGWPLGSNPTKQSCHVSHQPSTTYLQVRKDINDWVARYRRDTSLSGRPSYGNTYSAVNAVAGHLNSFGPTAPIPKKRLERLLKVRVGVRGGDGGTGAARLFGCRASDG